MKKIILSLLILTYALSATAQGLTRSECDTLRKHIIAEWNTAERARLEHNIKESCIRQGDNVMPIAGHVYGEMPKDGRSLWISLHGGGGCPKDVNDSQWVNQIELYHPAEGVYIAPRAPWDAWNMWCQEPIDSIFEELIRTMVCTAGVNPNKVYLIGYSAGGDGVWRVAPRMADHFAGASMMAGHPGDVNLVNLANTPYMIWCGADDYAYNRNVLCAQRGEQMDSLQRTMPGCYRHETYILQGKGHWMDLEDKAALPWLAQSVRNPYPKILVWQQEEVTRPYFFWVGAPQDEQKRGMRIDANIKGNTINITRCDYTHVTLYLNDELVNLDKKVTIRYKGKRIFRGQLSRTEATLRTTLEERKDICYAFPTQVEVNIPQKR